MDRGYDSEKCTGLFVKLSMRIRFSQLGSIRAPRMSGEKKEISCKIILANLDRFIQFVWIEVFYSADLFMVLVDLMLN
jgi:hypothetical protein